MSRRRARCGTEGAYRRHLRERTVPCRDCCDAHALHTARWRAGPLLEPPINPFQYHAARQGREVAEALEPADRARLVSELHALGWTDVQVATHTRMTTFTAGEIRQRLGLAPNRPSDTTSEGVA